VRLAELTTLRVGGEPAAVLEATTADELADAARGVWADGDDLLVIGGGSNLLVGDDGTDAVLLRVLTRGIEAVGSGDDGRTVVRVQAGEPWEALVAFAVEHDLAGLEALAGIPGSTGASPVQNIGAYGQELAQTLVAVELVDAIGGRRSRVEAAELGLGYRTSTLKQGRDAVVLSVDLALAPAGGRSGPIGYAQLASALGVEVGSSAGLAEVRDAVLALRGAKGMVLDAADPDAVSAGSFFTNPIVSEQSARTLPADAPRFPTTPDEPDAVVPLGEQPAAPAPSAPRRVKLSAGWLIEHAGIGRGFALPGSRAAVSSKHTLALVNTGGATAAEIAELARYIQARVRSAFGVELHPEPRLVGISL